METPTKSQSSKLLSSNSLSSKVRVVLRVRPFLPSEKNEFDEKNLTPCIKLVDPDHSTREEITVHLKDQYSSRNECYKLDSFFGQDDRVAQIFNREITTVIPGIFQGLNATVFAYGATGSGKTYTMQGTEDEPGLIPLAMSTILKLCENSQFLVEISYYEVYMDRCYDLLEPKAKEIMALDDHEGRLQLKGLFTVPVHSMDEFFGFFSMGTQRRKVAHTGLNDVSSRSHGVLAIVVTNGAIKGKLNLIDLAGNEDNRRTCNEGIRLQESAKINQSLFALSNVIYALNNNEPRIPYRESKLTRILQDSLGGTSRLLMITCLNPASYQEAVHTVSLAARSRQIVNYVDTANRKEDLKEKVDMEAKLKAWLESKGKTKSSQRINRPFSPPLGKTPTSANYLKNSRSIWSSAKTKTADCNVSNSKGRKLDLGTSISAAMEESILQSSIYNGEISSRVTGVIEVQHEKSGQDDAHDLLVKDQSMKYKNEQQYKALCIEERDGSSQLHHSSICKDGDSEIYTYTSYDGYDLEAIKIEDFLQQNVLNGRKEKCTSDVKILKSVDILGTPYNKENWNTSRRKESPPISQKIEELQASLIKVLSPKSSNVTTSKHMSSNDQSCLVLLEPKTPKTPYATTCSKDVVRMIGTPFDKFNALSSNLKDSLAQEYLAFLNVASKEELMQLKGIGQKRAEYILQLREDSPNPLKSLSDLENIGLSSKQVHDMFRRAARGIFA